MAVHTPHSRGCLILSQHLPAPDHHLRDEGSKAENDVRMWELHRVDWYYTLILRYLRLETCGIFPDSLQHLCSNLHGVRVHKDTPLHEALQNVGTTDDDLHEDPRGHLTIHDRLPHVLLYLLHLILPDWKNVDSRHVKQGYRVSWDLVPIRPRFLLVHLQHVRRQR